MAEAESNQEPTKATAKNKGNNDFLYQIGCLLWVMVVFFGLLYAAALIGGLVGVNVPGGGGLLNNSNGGQTAYDCAGVVNVPEKWMPWVKDAAAKYLGGDEAALIALIQTESSWRANAANDSSSAAGLAQMITGTARGYKEFTGGEDAVGITWPPGILYDKPAGHPDDARFDAKRSIYAAAHKIGFIMGSKKYKGDLGKAYEYGYHTHGSTAATATAAQSARARLEKFYNALIKGGCKLTSASVAGAGGQACGVVGADRTYVIARTADTRLMPPAAADFAQTARDFYQATGRKVDVVSMFRSREKQTQMCGGVMANGKCRNSLVAAPGKSMHEAGLAVDIGLRAKGRANSSAGLSPAEYEVFKRVAASHNWQVNRGSRGRFGADESWHFDYVGTKFSYHNISQAIKAAYNSCQ